MIDQFFSMMKYYTKLVRSRWSFFEFMRSLLENHIENIRKVGGSDRAKVYQACMEQLGSYSVDLWNIENANLVNAAQLVLSNLRAEHEYLYEEAEKRLAEQACNLDETRTSY